MTIYVDPLENFGWVLRGRKTASCHMFSDTLDLAELHRIAAVIGMQRRWFQDKRAAPHYDLTPNRRASAVAAGVVEVDRRAAVGIWQARRALVASLGVAA